MPRPRDNKQVTMLEEVPTVDARASHPAGPSSGTITSIDLFAGAGGLSLGFHLADLGYMPVFAVEHESAAAATFARNFGRLHRWLARPEVGAGFDVTPLWDHGDMSKAHEIVRTGMRQ